MDIHLEEAFDKALDDMKNVKDFTEKLYGNADIHIFFQKPAISMLITGCDYILVNLAAVKDALANNT